jgi:hypothetical protein
MLSAGWRSPAATDCRLHRHDVLRSAAWKSFRLGELLDLEFAVDEPIYRRLLCFLIATVDKFASLPWTGQVGAFFGRVDRGDKNGFYGPCDPTTGIKLPVSR